jgi:thiamine kinase-like enzyme
MTTKDLREEIRRAIQEVPDNFLEDILTYLKQIEKKSQGELDTFHNVRKILREDQELLEKLAK